MENHSLADTGGEKKENNSMSTAQIMEIRLKICDVAKKLLGIPYLYGSEWKDFKITPLALDCSEMVEGVYNFIGLKMPDGSQNQYNFCLDTALPEIGDLGFFGRSANPTQIFHVGLLFDKQNFIEARGYEPGRDFVTGRVILRSRIAWEKYKNFVGYRCHPKLKNE